MGREHNGKKQNFRCRKVVESTKKKTIKEISMLGFALCFFKKIFSKCIFADEEFSSLFESFNFEKRQGDHRKGGLARENSV